MRMAKGSLIVAVSVCGILCSGPIGAQGLRGHELLGLRLGGVITSGPFADNFGNGSEINLHFIHGLTNSLGIDFSLSSHNFGESKNQEKNREFFDRNDMNLQAFSVTVGMIALRPVHGPFTATLEAGPGLYSMNAILPIGFYDAQKTDNHLGLYGGIGALMKIADSFFLTANGSYHTVFVGTDSDDTVHFYTGESRVEFVQITLGIMIKTH